MTRGDGGRGGGLSVTGNLLRIAIPEPWLADAAYPVIVDPVIGLSSLGALGAENAWGYDEESEEEEEGGPSMVLSNNMGVNQFAAPHAIAGNCTACLYVDYYPGSYNWTPDTEKMWPVLYAHDPERDRPGVIKSSDGGYVSNDVGRSAGPPRGWRSADVVVDGSIQQGEQFWFGFLFWRAHPRYDYGGRLYQSFAWPYQGSYAGLRQKFYNYPIETETDTYTDAHGNETEYETWAEPSYELKISMYLEYAVTSTNHTRTLAQGVALTDSRKPAGNYRRSMTQTALGTTVTKGLEGFYRSVVQTVKNTMSLNAPLALARKVTQQAGTGDTARRLLSMLRKPAQTAGINSGTQRTTQAERSIADTGKPETETGRKQDFKRNIAHGGNTEAVILKRADYVKRFEETAVSTAATGVVRDMALRLVEAVAALYAMKAGAGFNRGIADKAGIASVMGGMVVFFRALFGFAGSGDSAGSFIARVRVIQDTETIGDETGRTADYLRGLFVEAGSIAETKHRAEYRRKQQDTAHSEAVPLRHLFIFLRLTTLSLVRDYLLPRFLRSREELAIKSPVCRELTLESRLH